MNEKLYKDLLRYSKNLIRKYPFLPLNEYDLVHECWDFKTEYTKIIKSKIARYFYDEVEKRDISFSNFKNSNGEELPIDLIGKKRNEIKESLKQCRRCEDILPTIKFTFFKTSQCYRKICNKCRNKVEKINPIARAKAKKIFYLKYREKAINSSKAYNKTERGKELSRLNRIKHKDKHKEKNRKRGLEYYARNREQRKAKMREMRKLKLWDDKTRNERQKRFWKKEKGILSDKYIIKILKRRCKKSEITHEMIEERRNKIIAFRNKKEHHKQ